MRARIAVALVLALAALLAFDAQPVAATNDNGRRVPNSGNVRFAYVGTMPQIFINASEWVRGNVIHPTDLTTSGAINMNPWDVKVGAADYGAVSWVGQWQCMSEWWNGSVWICTDGRVRYNLYPPKAPGGTWDDIEARSLACEEMGHSIGLDHRTESDGCMGGDFTQTGFSYHDRVLMVNAWY